MLMHTVNLHVPEQVHNLLRRVPPQSVQVFGRVTVQFVFRCFCFRHFICFFFLACVGSADSWIGARFAQNREWSSLQDFFCSVQEYVLATMCFSISCRDDVARVAGLLLQGRGKVVVRVCGFVVVLFHVECCFIIVVASCEVTRPYGLIRFLLHRDMHLYVG